MIRSKSIAITPHMDRWLRFASTLQNSTAEAIADQILTEALLTKYPKLKEIEDSYTVGRAKLWNEAADKLKEGK